MKKGNKLKTLSRSKDQKKALMKSLMTGLIENGSITTSLSKAKALKPLAEKQVSLAIKGLKNPEERVAKIRLLKKNLCQKSVDELLKIAEKIKERRGGYLRIVKLPFRTSDCSLMAKVEWVDEVLEKKVVKKDKQAKAKKSDQQ
ncbi:MAG: bL17 family ribosomal protein [Candidatus Moranbacteria bacterium]|jgi:large subunit ribosomal protein L17|nr:bL17 family ribosomal protein [Candidatus Moranbacteria bacterium]